MGLRGESQVSNDFPKIVDKIPDDRGWNRGKPGVNSVTLQRGGSESLRICLQSSYSRLCGGNRWLPLTAFIERRQGQVPLYIYNESPTRMPRIILLLVLSLEASIVGNKRSFRELCSDLLPLHNVPVKSHDFIACASVWGNCCYHTVRDCVVICV